MLLFFYILLIIIILFLILGFSEIKIILENFEFNINNIETINSKKWNVSDYRGKLGLYFLGKVKIISFNLNNNKYKNKFKKDYIKEKIEKAKIFNKNKDKKQKVLIKKAIKKLLKQIKIDKINLKICVDTTSVSITSYIVAIISTIISNIIRTGIKKFNHEKHSFEVSPIYKNENYLYVKFNCIISIKVVHIINMFKLIGGKNNERSSNRRFNVNCYGKY